MQRLALKDGRVIGDDVTFRPATVSGDPITPRMIVMHDTAGSMKKYSSVRWFQSKECQTSAHFVIEVDGEIVQMVRTDRKAAHAGQSVWKDQKLCNGFSIGIEVVNPGMMREHQGRACLIYEGGKIVEAFPMSQCVAVNSPQHGQGLALPYADAQIDSIRRLCRLLADEYADIQEIVGHYEISPRRKVDPTPLFPFDVVRAYALNGAGAPDETSPSHYDPPREPTMATSKEGGVQVVNGTFGTGTAVYDAQNVATKVIERAVDSGKPIAFLDIALAVVSSPMFIIGLTVAIGSAAAWYFRAQKRWHQGI